MARRKAKADSTVSFNITLPARLAARLDVELQKTRQMVPYMVISRSAFLSHAFSEWLSLLSDPAFEPTLPARQRVRPPVRPPSSRRKAQLTHDEVRAIRADARPLQSIARDMKVAISTVSRIKAGLTWASVA